MTEVREIFTIKKPDWMSLTVNKPCLEREKKKLARNAIKKDPSLGRACTIIGKQIELQGE